MHESLLEILAEPGTRAPLVLTVRKFVNDEIEEGELRSEATGRVFPIARGIPRFVPPSAYTDTFGKQWNLFRTTQLDSAMASSYSERRFDLEAGWTEEELRGRTVLDAGCGAGRFAEIVAKRGGRLVALDMSSAVDAAKQTLQQYRNVDVVQASLLEPPFKKASFDYAYSIGVLQHTPDPTRGITTVVECVKPAGRFTFTIYARRPWTKLNMKYIVRHVTKRIPSELLLRGIEGVMPYVFPAMDKLFRIPKLGRLAQFVIPVAVYVDDKGFSDAERYQEAVLDTFDMLAPAYDSPLTYQETDAALRRSSASSWHFRSRVPIVVNGMN